MTKTNVNIALDGDASVRNVISQTVKALKRANMNLEAENFQREVCNGEKPYMEVVKEYVTLK